MGSQTIAKSLLTTESCCSDGNLIVIEFSILAATFPLRTHSWVTHSSIFNCQTLHHIVLHHTMSAKRLIPLLDRVLVEKLVPPSKSVGGVLLPESATTKVRCPVWSPSIFSIKNRVFFFFWR